MICKLIFWIHFQQPELILLYSVLWFHAFLSHTNISIYYQLFFKPW